MTKKLGSVLLALVLVLACAVPAAAQAADALETKRLQLEDTYNINIIYESDPDGSPSIGTGSLATLDQTLQSISAPVVRQVSAYYQETLGKKITFSYVYSNNNAWESNLLLLGSFNTQTAVIELYIPKNATGTVTTGDSPITIAHEFGHAFYLMYVGKFGERQMEQDWVALNGGVRYNTGYIAYAYNKLTFMSGYGASSLEEDFAEIFGHAFVRNRDGLGFSHRLLSGESRTPLGAKVDYIARMLPACLTETDTAVANLNRVFSTPTFLYYQGLALSGEHMQFIGCTYPRYVLNGLLGLYGIQAQQSDWVRDVGGWQVLDTAGNYYLVFPGGYVEPLQRALTLAA